MLLIFEGRNLLKADAPAPTCWAGTKRKAAVSLASIGTFCYNLLSTSRIFPWEKYDDRSRIAENSEKI